MKASRREVPFCFYIQLQLILLRPLMLSYAQSTTAGCEYDFQVCAQTVLIPFLTFPDYRDFRTPDLITLKGYPVECHSITTKDGYIISQYRIPHGRFNAPRFGRQNKARVPVYLRHGVPGSSAHWMWQPEGKGLVFMLADAGFDVWIGNARGTSYSNCSTHYPSTDERYWDFDLTDSGLEDLPDVTDHILKVTGYKNMYYICHSLGCGEFAIATILHDDYREKIDVAIMLAPGIYSYHTTAFTKALVAPVRSYEGMKAVSRLTNGQFLPNKFVRFLNQDVFSYCTKPALDCGICDPVFNLFYGVNFCQTNVTLLPGFLTHALDTSSVKMQSQFAQWFFSGKFAHYDYGPARNKKKYGTRSPPLYDWNKYTVPTVIFYGQGDVNVHPNDVMTTVKMMGKNVKELKKVDNPRWNHIDFLIGIDADVLVYNRVVQILKNKIYG